MAVSFIIAENMEVAKNTQEAVEFSEIVQDFLRQNRNLFEEDIDILVQLDPFSDVCIAKNEVIRVKEAAKSIQSAMKNQVRGGVAWKELNDFIVEIIEFCNEAIDKGMCLMAVGD